MKKLRNIIPMLLFPIIILYLFEWYTHNPFTTMKIRIQLLNIVLFELIMALLLFLFGKLKTALRCQTILFMIIGLANYYVLEFRSAPIMPWDILSIGTAASVANNFKYTLSKETVFVLIGFVILILLESKVTLELKERLAYQSRWCSGVLCDCCGLHCHAASGQHSCPVQAL